MSIIYFCGSVVWCMVWWVINLLYPQEMTLYSVDYSNSKANSISLPTCDLQPDFFLRFFSTTLGRVCIVMRFIAEWRNSCLHKSLWNNSWLAKENYYIICRNRILEFMMITRYRYAYFHSLNEWTHSNNQSTMVKNEKW